MFQFYKKPRDLMKHISLRMRQKKRMECAKKHRKVFTDVVQAFVGKVMLELWFSAPKQTTCKT